MQKLRIQPLHIVCVTFALVIFCVYAYPIFVARGTPFTWPDEMANFQFARQFAATGTFSIPEPLAAVSKELVHPRSTNVYAGAIVPGTFIAFVLLIGVAMRLVSSLALYVVPFIAVLGGLALWRIVARYATERIGAITLFLYCTAPAVWYYSSFSMLPNMVFCGLLLIAWWLWQTEGRFFFGRAFVAGMFCMLAVGMRPFELLWIAASIATYFFVARTRPDWKRVTFALAGVAVMAAPLLWHAQHTFGSWLGSGYLNLSSGSFTGEVSARGSNSIAWIRAALVPFGLHPIRALVSFISRFFVYHWFLITAAAVGMITLWRSGTRITKAVVAAAVVGAAVLVLYYGSWAFEDQVTLKLSTLGISYVRYWIPIAIAASFFAATALESIVETLSRKERTAALVLIGIFVAGLSGTVVWQNGKDSLTQIVRTRAGYVQTAATITAKTEQNAVVVTERADKIIWPARAVISKWGKEDVGKLQALAVAHIPLYFFGLEKPADLGYLNGRVLASYELHIISDSPVATTPDGTLYRLVYTGK